MEPIAGTSGLHKQALQPVSGKLDFKDSKSKKKGYNYPVFNASTVKQHKGKDDISYPGNNYELLPGELQKRAQGRWLYRNNKGKFKDDTARLDHLGKQMDLTVERSHYDDFLAREVWALHNQFYHLRERSLEPLTREVRFISTTLIAIAEKCNVDIPKDPNAPVEFKLGMTIFEIDDDDTPELRKKADAFADKHVMIGKVWSTEIFFLTCFLFSSRLNILTILMDTLVWKCMRACHR